MDRFRKFLMIFGPIIGVILLYFIVRYAVLAFQEDKGILDEVSPATMEEVLTDPTILQSLEEPVGDAAAAAAEEPAAEVAASEALTDTAPVEETGGVTATEVATETAPVEEAGGVTVTEVATETAPVEETSEVSGTEAAAEPAAEEIGGPDSVLAEFHQAPIPDEYADLTSPIEADADSLARGKETFTTLCVTCHGESGMGDGPAGAALVPPPAPIAQTSQVMSDAYLFWRISEGGIPFGTAMPPWKGSLDENARWDVINYVRSLGAEPGSGAGAGPGKGEGAGNSQGQGPGGGPAGAARLGEADWTILAMYDANGEPVKLVEGTEITLSFKDGALSGASTCSNYVGKYEADDETITIELTATSPLEDAPEACAGDGPATEQEAMYLDALQSVASYDMKRAKLDLRNEDGELVLRFKAVRE